jgi:hypothetical protein
MQEEMTRRGMLMALAPLLATSDFQVRDVQLRWKDPDIMGETRYLRPLGKQEI